MKKLIILVFLLFISISAVSAADNLTDSGIANADDIVCEVDEPLPDSENVLALNESDVDGVVSVSNDTDGDVIGDSSGLSNASNSTKVTIKGKDLVWYTKANPTYEFKVVDSNGTGVAVKNVALTINGKTKYVNTDANGIGKLSLKNIKAGTYVIKGKYSNVTFKNKISLFSSRISKTKDITSTYGKRVKFYLKLVSNSGKPVYKKKVKFTIGKKTYYRTTDKNGFVTLRFNWNSGKYIIKYYTSGLKGKNTYTVKNYVKLDILKWGLTGDVSWAPLIKNNMPNNVWVKKAVAATKKGLPLLTIKGGNGKTVFMTAGVHGNEVNPQVAAMKMIDYLTTHKIKGTVYIIPFVNVKAISQKVRLTSYDFNRVAHRSGYVSNNIINLILKKKCDAYGDFHSTVSPGVPGINVVLGYTSPGKCVGMTNYISKNSHVNKIFYYPGEKYRWSLADYCNLKGTPAVICEVISPVNHVSSGATSLSYKQMTCFLKYNSII